MSFKSTHKLDFEVAEYNAPFNDGYKWMRFRIGTCEGLWTSDGKNYMILAVKNHTPNNGHFKDVLEWFENSCKRDKMNLVIMEFFSNQSFKKHLIEKQGFQPHQEDNVIKIFDNGNNG